MTIWIDVRTSVLASSSAASDVAVLPFGPSRRRRTETLFALANAASIVDARASANIKPIAINTSGPLNIEIFGANDVLSCAFLPGRSRDRIPSNVTVHEE